MTLSSGERLNPLASGLCFKVNNCIMTANDGILLVKKIVIGVIVTVVPFAILFGGLVLLQKILQ